MHRVGLEIDRASFQLGMINCFCEMVAAGLKRLAISPPLSPLEYEAIREASETIVTGSGIHSFKERSLLVTHLQSAEFTQGKWSILYFKDPEVLEEYLALKETRNSLVDADALTSEAQEEISRAFMEMLSYPQEVIEDKIKAGGQIDPFVLE
jgi:hypothetical protein